MIDIHAHVLPGLDDGPYTLEEAVKMARLAVRDGVRTVVATPHVASGLFENSRAGILAAVEFLREVLGREGVPLEVLPGAEYMLEPDLPRRLAAGELLTLSDMGRHLLVEFPGSSVPPFVDQVLFEILLQGVVPIIAHPERNAEVSRRPELLYRMVERGALAQLTAASVVGEFGRDTAELAAFFLRCGWVHFVASDAHSAGSRPPVLSAAVRVVETVLGEEPGRRITSVNPGCVVRGEVIRAGTPEPPVRGRERGRAGRCGFWARLFGRR